MKRTLAILGTLLIAAMIIVSGSAVAAWYYAQGISSYQNVVNRFDMRYAPNGQHGSLGDYGPPAVLGWIVLDLGSGNEMPNSQDFTVFADSASNETYAVHVGEIADPAQTTYVGTGWDTEDLIFQTPSTGKGEWRYIYLEGVYGTLSGDPSTGPEIDAVGWED